MFPPAITVVSKPVDLVSASLDKTTDVSECSKDIITVSNMTKMNAPRLQGKQLRTGDFPDGSRIASSRNFGADTLRGLQELRSNRQLCDVIFVVEGAELPAHRCLLAMHSAYFRAMFVSEGFQEGSRACCTIQLSADVVSRPAVEAVLDFIYTGQLKLTGDTVQGLIMTADHWQMAEVKESCVHFLEQLIDTHNCLGMLQFSDVYRCEGVREKCEQLVRGRFAAVVEGEEFLTLPAHVLAPLLSLPDLTLGPGGEDVVLKAVFRWLEYDPARRLGDLPMLLRTVHLNQTSQVCRSELLHNNPLIQDNQDLQELMNELLLEDREARQAQPSLMVIGGFRGDTARGTPLSSVEIGDPLLQKWTSCADLPFPSTATMAFSVQGHLFCLACRQIQPQGGSKLRATETQILQYRFIQNEWVDAQSSFTPHALERLDVCLQNDGAIAVCPTTNTIYAVSHSEVCTLSMEVVDGDILCTKIQQLPMPSKFFSPTHRGHSAVVVGGRLYVLGGDRGRKGQVDPAATASVVVFDPRSKAWTACADMLEARVKLAAVELGGHIYVCGGFDVRRMSSVERYDPCTDTWTSLTPMTLPRSHHHLLPLHNRLWAVGGKAYTSNKGGARKVASNCDIYDPDTDTWTEGPSMKDARCKFAAAVV